jgi:hypothetical protein
MADNQPPPEPGKPGESPGSVGGAGGSRADLQSINLFRYALTQQFDVSPQLKAETLKRLEATLKTAKSPRTVIAVARVLATLGSVNLSSIDTAIRVRQQVELADEIAELKKTIEEAKAKLPIQ